MSDLTASEDNTTLTLTPAIWLMYGGWLVACAIGWGVGGHLASRLSQHNIVAAVLGVSAGALLSGLLQWAVLRHHLGSGLAWLASIVLGLACSAAFGILVFLLVGLATSDAQLPVDSGWVAGAASLGLCVGLVQWQLLRNQYDHAGWWVLASAAGWFLGGPLLGLVSRLLDLQVGNLLSWMFLGVSYALPTGWMWMRFLGRS